EHGQAKELAHGKESEEGAEMGIGLAEELHDEAEQAVTGHKGPAGHTGGGRSSCCKTNDQKQQQTLQKRLVELRRMPRHTSTTREDDSPGDIRLPAVQLAIDEVADPAQTQSDR